MLVVVVVVLILLFKLYLNIPDQKATIILKMGEKRERIFEGQVLSEMTVLDSFNAATAAGKIKVGYSLDADNQTHITKIDNRTDIGSFRFYLNSKQLDPLDLNKIKINGNDLVEIIVR